MALERLFRDALVEREAKQQQPNDHTKKCRHPWWPVRGGIELMKVCYVPANTGQRGILDFPTTQISASFAPNIE